jgi:hypothetical protein
MLSTSVDISLSDYGKFSLVYIRTFMIVTDVLLWKAMEGVFYMQATLHFGS